MPSKNAIETPSSHPPLGTIIDDGALQLVEIVGLGGYGVCYRAVEVANPSQSYAVKCLPQSHAHSSRHRQLHLREIMLHRLASSHPNVVTLHRVLDEDSFTYIIMDFAKDGDLFTQILNNRRYLGNNALIKHVFLQLIDALEYCHNLGM
jgi:serine/threonine protein kinase